MADTRLLSKSQIQQLKEILGIHMFTQAQAMGRAARVSMAQMQATQGLPQGLWSGGFGLGIGGGMSQPGMSHLGVVREFRKKFKEYTKAEFREMGSQPVIKEILSGMTKLNKEQIQERIAEHLAAV